MNKSIPISNIDRHTIHVRRKNDAETIKRYSELIKEGAEFPPPVVFEIQTTLEATNGKKLSRTQFLCVDGVHRIEAAQRIGETSILCVVKPGTMEEAIWFAAGANKAHGLPMDGESKRNVIGILVKAFPNKTQREIATQVGCTQQYVQKILARLKPNTGRRKSDPEPTPEPEPDPEPNPEPQPNPTPESEQPGKKRPVKNEDLPLDETGHHLTPETLALWNRRGEHDELMAQVAKLRSWAERNQTLGDPAFDAGPRQRVDFQKAMRDLKAFYLDLKAAQPYAVCYTCQGQHASGCTTCHGRGLLGIDTWNCAPDEAKAIRERNRKGGAL